MNTKTKILMISLLLLPMIVLVQCGGKSTNPTTVTPQQETNLIGQWQWVKSVRSLGIYEYTVSTPESENKYRMYEFHDDSTYTVTEIASSLKDSFSGNYHFTFDTSSGDIIHTAPHRSFKYKLAKDSLFLTERCCNYYKQTYVRVEE